MVSVTILEISSRKEIKINLPTDWCVNEETLIYNFQFGNYSCDCMRKRMFENKFSEMDKCSSGFFLVQIFNENGEMIYNEFNQ